MNTSETKTAPPDPLLLDLPQVSRMVGMSRASIYRLLSERAFPPPRRIAGRRLLRWHRADVIHWAARQPKDPR